MSYAVTTEQFSGPLDLLLTLIEREEFDITTISLAQVANEYLRYVRTSPDINPHNLADFLLVAARLILLKSKALLPNLDLDAEPADLATQLKLYQAYAAAAKEIEQMIAAKQFSVSRDKLPDSIRPEFHPPATLTASVMSTLFTAVLDRLEPLLKLPQKMLAKVISIEEKIADIRARITKLAQTTFRELVRRGDAGEAIVSFLALLELVKQRSVQLEQGEPFGDITIRSSRSS
ncbi:MAG: segregation/condensation protein A [Patescibacteria group bacterium]